MSKHRQLLYGQPLPQDFLDALQEFVGTMASPNLDLTMVSGSANQVQIVAGTGSNQVSLGIDGLWRYISVTTQTTVSGAAGTYDIFVTCNSNSFSVNPSPPPPELDGTDYTFALSTPLIQGNTPAAPHFRKVGEAIFDGTRILSLRQTVDIDSSQGFQSGDLKTSAAANPQAGWLLCNGQLVSRTTYAALYAALGGSSSPWGQGDGSTTFAVPDLRSRAPVGAGQGAGLSARTLAAVGGEETHLLLAAESGVNGNGNPGTSDESVRHAHTGTTDGESGHTHTLVDGTSNGVWANNGSGSVGGGAGVGGIRWYQQNTGGANASHTHTFTTANNAAGHTHNLVARNADAAHNNMQPWVAVNWFVKT